MALNQIQQCAVRDAEADFAELDKTARDWLIVAASIHAGNHLGPALTPLEAVGVEQTCRSWGVDPAQWSVHASRWIREYASFYACAIETLAGRSGRTS